MTRLAVAIGVAVLAFALYHATLLPGFDFGDTGSFQTMAGERNITPRDAYPLYFAIGDLVLRARGGDPAHAFNLATALEGAVACGLFVLAAAELSGALLAAAAAALIFATSYTFWSQAVIAEVYTLHIAFVCLTLLLLLRWEARPTLARLAAFFAAYALGFGNHLSMILLAPGYVLFLLVAAPHGWRSMFAPKVVALALAIAAAGALQYAWNLQALWLWPNHPTGAADLLQRFWFDVTKTDWRETTIGHVPESMLRDRLAMYFFDLRQQFGWAAWLAPIGLVRLFAKSWRRGALLLALFAIDVAFAFAYNVGDTHVFYLPSHAVLALLMACALAPAGAGLVHWGRAHVAVRLVPIAAILFAAWQAYDNFPALDRSGDTRPTETLAALTRDLDDRRGVLVADLNWQVQNGLSYFSKHTRPEVAWTPLANVLLYAPTLAADNAHIDRSIVLTARAEQALSEAYGPTMAAVRDPRVPTRSLADTVRLLPRGTRYVLCVLKPTREFQLPAEDLHEAIDILTAGRLRAPASGDYVVLTGLVGEAPALASGADRPFRRSTEVGGVPVVVRMESWLADDTIRRMGFAQVVAAHHHTLIAERGVSFAAFDEHGRATVTAYAANLFAPQPRYRVEPQS